MARGVQSLLSLHNFIKVVLQSSGRRRSRYKGIFNAGLSPSPLSLYLIMLCEFWIFPPALKWNVNY